jgi:HAD superfamily hydrolase (TIGR01509 family)
MSLPRRPRAAVFDLDGTLIDSEALVREGYFAAADKFALNFTDADFLSLVGLHRDDNDARLMHIFGADYPLEPFYETVRAHIGDRAAALKPGALELMDALDAAGAPFALATSSNRPWVERHFAAHNLTHRFRAVMARGDYANAKPHPEPYLNAAAALGFAPHDTLALEDSHAGVRSAHAAGLMTVMVPDLLAPDDDMRAKAIVVASLHEILPWL